MNKKRFFLLLLLPFILFSCQQTAQAPEDAPAEAETTLSEFEIPKDFAAHWYDGLAELNSYDLQQVRYGEIHEGHAVLIFVTEDFSKSKLVKLDNPGAHPADKVSILKLNDSRKFLTGIYPYSMMRSVFTPVDLKKHPNSLKLTTTSQEWCGHTFSQLSLDKNAYQMELRSYFESEGDVEKQFPKALLEDEIWTRLRIDPKSIPMGLQEIVPSNLAARLRHRPIRPEKAFISVEDASGEFAGEAVKKLSIDYSEEKRSLSIYYKEAFPFDIMGWDESYASPAWRPDGPQMTSKARRKKSMRLDYWSRNSNSDRNLRDQLGI